MAKKILDSIIQWHAVAGASLDANELMCVLLASFFGTCAITLPTVYYATRHLSINQYNYERSNSHLLFALASFAVSDLSDIMSTVQSQ